MADCSQNGRSKFCVSLAPPHHPPSPSKSTTCNKGTEYQFTATTWKGFRRTAPLDFKRWYNFAQNLRIDKNHFFSLNQINVLVSVLPNPKQAAPLFLPLRKEVLFSCQDLVLMEASRPRKKDCLAPNGVYLLLAKRGWEVFQQEARWRSCQRAKLLSFFKNSGARSKPTFILQNKTLHLAQRRQSGLHFVLSQHQCKQIS